MAAEFAEHGIRSLFVYTREAHPGERYGHHTSMEQKLEHARQMVRRHGLRRPVLVDDLEGSVHAAYGRLPNMTYIVAAGGKVLYRANWTDPRSIRLALEELLWQRRARASGQRLRPYYVEWEPQFPADRIRFVETLLEVVGPRAVEEYVAATAHRFGEAAAKPLREWWQQQQG